MRLDTNDAKCSQTFWEAKNHGKEVIFSMAHQPRAQGGVNKATRAMLFSVGTGGCLRNGRGKAKHLAKHSIFRVLPSGSRRRFAITAPTTNLHSSPLICMKTC